MIEMLNLRSRVRGLTSRFGIPQLAESADKEELEQSLLRVAIGGIVLLYLAFHVYRSDRVSGLEARILWVAIGFFILSIALTLQILATARTSVARRYLGMIADNAVTSFCLIETGEAGAVIIGVYLFITFGNGFRYGRAYLHACQVLSLIGFGCVIALSEFWRSAASLSIGIAISILALPFYVGVLAQRMTEAKKRADDANLAKGRFVANVSHEMRTPLNGVIAMADVLRDTKLDESQREMVDTLGASANLLLAQIEDVLDMAKIEAGRIEIEERPFDLVKVMTSTVKVVLPQARPKGITIDCDLQLGSSRHFTGDSHHVSQVLLNLLANAVKFTEQGRVVLRASIVTEDVSETLVRVEVEDTGIGIPDSKLSDIFEPFTQADDSITRVYGGTGLGITIAKQLVTLMGGTIGVTSAVGRGSCFWFELPMRPAADTGIDLTVAPPSSDRTTDSGTVAYVQQGATVTKLRGARILVAEDNPTNQRVTRLILESAGHRVLMVSSGEAALDALEQQSFDLALFDLSMPVVSGLAALKLYRFSTPEPIPVLILSANVTTDVIAECELAGSAEFIAKPVRPAILLDAIERHLTPGSAMLQAGISPARSDERPLLTVVDAPAVDPAVLEDLGRISTDPTFVERLLRGFRSDTERLVAEIADALAARRYEQVKDAAHALKGGAGSVGATQLVSLALRLENATYETLRSRAGPWTDELRRAAERVLQDLEAHIQKRNEQQSNSS